MGALCALAATLFLRAGALAGYSVATPHNSHGALSPRHAARTEDTGSCLLLTVVNGREANLTVRIIGRSALQKRYAISNGLAQETDTSDLVAMYSPADRTIFLPSDFRPNDALQRSDLLHELVHHAQAVSGMTRDRFALERQAYQAQISYLRSEGELRAADFLTIMMLLKTTDPAATDYRGC